MATAEDVNAGMLLQVTVHEADAESSRDLPRQAMAGHVDLQWFEAHPEDAVHGVSAMASRYLYALNQGALHGINGRDQGPVLLPSTTCSSC